VKHTFKNQFTTAFKLFYKGTACCFTFDSDLQWSIAGLAVLKSFQVKYFKCIFLGIALYKEPLIVLSLSLSLAIKPAPCLSILFLKERSKAKRQRLLCRVSI
jgi:hypothetical protein